MTSAIQCLCHVRLPSLKLGCLTWRFCYTNWEVLDYWRVDKEICLNEKDSFAYNKTQVSSRKVPFALGTSSRVERLLSGIWSPFKCLKGVFLPVNSVYLFTDTCVEIRLKTTCDNHPL